MRDEDLIDADEAAKLLGMHKESFLRAIRRETLNLSVYEKPAPHAARKFYFDRAEITEELAARQPAVK